MAQHNTMKYVVPEMTEQFEEAIERVPSGQAVRLFSEQAETPKMRSNQLRHQIHHVKSECNFDDYGR